MLVMSLVSPPAPLGSLALNTRTQAGRALLASSSAVGGRGVEEFGILATGGAPKPQPRFITSYNRCILCEGPLSCDRTCNLGVRDLWMDL